MTFGKSVSTCFSKYAVFTGRASRSEYWWFALFNVIVTLLIIAIFLGALYFTVRNRMTANPLLATLNPDALMGDEELTSWSYTLMAIIGIYGLIAFLPGLGVSIRRLHDAGHSGWFYLLSFIPFVGPIILLVFLLQPSTPVPNRYGNVPD